MIGLSVTFQDLPPLRCALLGDGVMGVGVHVVRRKGAAQREAMFEAGGLDGRDGTFGKWLRARLRPGDEIRVRVAEIDHPSAWSPELPWPEEIADVAVGYEVSLNGTVLGHATVERWGLLVAMVTCHRRIASGRTTKDRVDLDARPFRSMRLAVGDEVVIRMT